MPLVEVVCDVSSIIVIFGPAPNSKFSGQHFGMEGPMPYHRLEIAKLGVP